MDVGRRKVGSSRTGAVAAGSVWESRMKLDEVKGGIKVFNDEENANNSEENDCKDVGASNNSDDVAVSVDKKAILRPREGVVGASGKRKTWKSESLEGSPIQIARQRSEGSKNLEEQCRELSMSADGIRKSPIQNKKTRSQATRELSSSVDGIAKSPVQMMKKRSVSQKLSGDFGDGIEKNSTQLRKLKSESTKALTESGSEENSELRKVKSESIKVIDEPSTGNAKNSLQLVKAKSEEIRDGIEGEIEKEKLVDETIKSPSVENQGVGIKKTKSDENCKEFGVCEEKVITTNLITNAVKAKSPPKEEKIDDDFDDADGDEEDWDDDHELDEKGCQEIEVEIEKKSLVVKEISIPEQKPKKVVVEEERFLHSNERPTPIPSVVKKQSPLMSHARVHPSPSRSKPDEFMEVPRTHSKLQSFVDLVMWRDVSKSAFVFGIGTFVIMSSSYTKDLNISLISVFAYLGLVYLAAIFLFRSFISRETVDLDDSSMAYVLGQDEAVWLVNLILPYVNECLVQIKALFSGDPATTMKMAVLLFILARCGSSITLWKMAKLGFFGVFTVPKICSSYSSQLSAYGTFWIKRFRDAWESCSHKKAVAFGIFTIVWNLSSMVARIWAVFMLFVAFRYFQPSLRTERWAATEEVRARGRDSPQAGQRCRPVLAEAIKEKKPL